MSASFYDLTVGSYTQIVQSSLGVLKKGADHFAANNVDLDEVVESRLIDDMANLHFQVVCITHHSLEALNAMASGRVQAAELRADGLHRPAGPDGRHAGSAQRQNRG